VLGSTHTRKMERFQFLGHHRSGRLFFGIFICMQPALQILNAHGAELGLNNPSKFFWGCGTLSSFLDNAPTYLVYFEAANAMTHSPGPGILALQKWSLHPGRFTIRHQPRRCFMGSMTYIGTGQTSWSNRLPNPGASACPAFSATWLTAVFILLPLLVLLNGAVFVS